VPGFLDRLPCVLTPKQGWHVYYRCQLIEGNQKLAESRERKTLIETRGEGGYVVAPGSPLACHPLKKPYQLIRGDLTQIPTISPDERQILLNTARSFNERPQKRVYQSQGGASTNGDRPGDLYNTRVSWHDLMASIGCTATGTRGEAILWKRPGKTTPGHSAITGNGDDMLYVFSSNFAPFEPDTAYDRFGAYATWWPSWRNGEILGGRALRASSLDKVLSSRFAHNELMRLCLLRWEDERHVPTFRRCRRHFLQALINCSFSKRPPKSLCNNG
jgi:hypothetical protein